MRKIAESLEELPPTLTYGTSPGGLQVIPRWRGSSRSGDLDTRDLAEIADVIGDHNEFGSVTQTAGGTAVTTVYDNDLVLSLTKRNASGSISSRIIPPAGFGMVTWDHSTQASAWRCLGVSSQEAGWSKSPLLSLVSATTDPRLYGTFMA